MKPLSERERRFVAAYLGKAAGNATKAAELAGYKPANARPQASRLLTKANIRAAVEAGRATLQRSSIADAQERREILTRMARRRKEHSISRQKAVDILNKMDGLYINKHEHSGVDGQPIQVITGVPQVTDGTD